MKTVCYNAWSVKGVNFISDILSQNNQFMSFTEFKLTHNINCNFLKYFGLVSAVSICYGKQLIIQNMSHKSQLLTQLKNLKKITSFAYQLFCTSVSVTPKAQKKWAIAFENVPGVNDMNWNEIYNMPYKCTLDTKTHYLQYRFIHRILPTNTFLYKIGLVNNNKCTFCKEDEETMEHLMWLCDNVSKVWHEVFSWLNELHINVNIAYWEVCFGITENTNYSTFLNMIVLLFKRYVYKCRVQEMQPLFIDFKNHVIFTEKIEKHIAKSRDKYCFHVKKWEPFLMQS